MSSSSEDNSGQQSPLMNSMIVDSQIEVRSSASINNQGSTLTTASLIMLNATLGAGLLNFPAAFNAGGGILSSMMMQIILALLAGFSFVIVAWLSDLRACSTYQDTVGSLCGIKVRNVCSVLMILYTYGSCVAYLIVVGDESDRVFSVYYGPDFCKHWYMDRKFVISLASIFLILPLCYAKKIDFLKYASGLATAGILYFVALAIYVFYTDRAPGVFVKTKPDHWTEIFKLVPTICFAYQSHLSVVPTYACMEKRNLKQFSLAVLMAALLSFIIYSIIGIYGYLTYGVNVKADILSSFPVGDVVVAIGFVVFAIKVFFTYPVMEYVGREALESFWTQILKLDRVQIILGERRRRYWFASLWFTTSLLIGIFVPNILIVINFLGSFAALFIFVFPGFCILKALLLLNDSFDTLWLKRMAYAVSLLYIFVGFFIFGLTFAQVAEDLSIFQSNTDSTLKTVDFVSRNAPLFFTLRETDVCNI